MNKCVCLSHYIITTQSEFPYKDSGRDKSFSNHHIKHVHSERHVGEHNQGASNGGGGGTRTQTQIYPTGNKPKDELRGWKTKGRLWGSVYQITQ